MLMAQNNKFVPHAPQPTRGILVLLDNIIINSVRKINRELYGNCLYSRFVTDNILGYNNSNNINHDICNRDLPSDTTGTHASVLITRSYIRFIIIL